MVLEGLNLDHACAIGSVDLRSLKGKQQLIEAFASHSAVALDHRPSELVYQVLTKKPHPIAHGSVFCHAQCSHALEYAHQWWIGPVSHGRESANVCTLSMALWAHEQAPFVFHVRFG